MGIRARMLASFGLILSLSVCLVIYVMVFGVPFTTYTGSYGQERAAAFRHLSLIADLKQDRLELWFKEREGDAAILTDRDLMGESVGHARQLLLQGLAQGKSPDELKSLLLADRQVAQLDWVLKLFQGAYHPYDEIQFAEWDTGAIFASTREEQVGTRIEKDIRLSATSAPSGRMNIIVSNEAGTDRAQLIVSNPILGKSSSTNPVGNPVAVAILRVQTDGFIKPMLYTGEGLGRTGEIVLVNKDGWNLISLKFPLKDGRKPKPLEYQITAKPAILALSGQQGIVSADDYRGVPVLAALRQIEMGPGTHWGMVVKMDEAEVLGPLWLHTFWSLITGLIGLLGIIALAAFSADKILRPVRNLSQTAEEVERGNFTVRAHVQSAGELAALTSTFNSMVERFENWHTELEQQVSDRTARLNRMNEDLIDEIGERTRAEQALAAERQRLAVTLRSIGDGVITTDTSGRVVSVNVVGEVLTGWKETEAVGRPIQEVFNIVHEHSRELCRDPVHAALATGQIVDLDDDTVLIGRFGTERIVADTCAPVRDATGRLYGTVLVFRDVTAAKMAERALVESEERFRQLADNVQDVFWITEPGNPRQIAYVNPAHRRVWGVGPEYADSDFSMWIGQIHEDDRGQVTEAYERFLSSGEDYDVEFRIIKPDGIMRWLWARAFPVKDGNDTIVRVAGLTQDITRRKLDEQRQDQLVEEIKNFAYIVSHDLRAPLSNLKGFNQELRRSLEELKRIARNAIPVLNTQDQLACKTLLETEIPEALEFMDASVARMSSLIAAILNLSRLGHRELSFTRVNMDRLVAETLQTMAHQITQKGVEVRLKPLPEVVADLTSMEQILSNLLLNAINYLDPDRPGIVEIWSGNLGPDAAFHIRDNGVGIEPENQSRIFEMFQRVRRVDVQGEGMGLACVRTLVRRHGGRVWCSSEPGVGSTFTFTVPNQSERLGRVEGNSHINISFTHS
jgi:PAS domain S-box-containing protein